MIHDLQCLAQRVQRLQMAMLDAPVPRYLEYKRDQERYFDDPQTQERHFASKFHEKIPDDYLNFFKLTMDSVSEWLSEYAEQNIREFNPLLQVKYKPNTKITRDFKTHVMEFTLAINNADDSLSLTWVVVRPCAERHKFYTEFLFQLQIMVKYYKFHRLNVEDITNNNYTILQKMGFFFVMKNAFYTRNNLEFVTEESWKRPRYFPTAAFLNNETLVNDFYYAKRYNTDFDFPDTYKEVPDSYWFEVTCWPCDSELDDNPPSGSGILSYVHERDSKLKSEGSAHKKSRFD